MSLYSDEVDKQHIFDDLENKLKRKSNCWSFKSVKSEEDKRARREVANNNERRRMQSINAGFENLRKLLPYCVDSEKISKASILQTTSKYIHELKTRINSLENELLRMNPESKICHSSSSESCAQEFNEVIEKIPSICETKQTSISDYTNDLGSSTSSLNLDTMSSSMISLKSCDNSTNITITSSSSIIEESFICNSQPQNTLEHLLAAVAQIERQEAMETISTTFSQSLTNPEENTRKSMANIVVMKPTISPFAEKIIEDANNMQKSRAEQEQLFYGSVQKQPCSVNLSSKIAIPHKYLHRPNVVLSRSNDF